MAQIYVNYTAESGLNESKKLLETMKDITKEDELVINMSAQDAHQADRIFEMLDENEFEYLPKGDETGDRYYILATRK